MYGKYLITCYLNCTISFESDMMVLRVKNEKPTINNKVIAIEQIFWLDLVK